MNQSGFVNIDYVVSSVLNELEEDERSYERLTQMAIEGYVNDLHLTITPEFKTVVLSVEDNNTVLLPKDYVDYLAIGVEYEGVLRTFTRNDSIKLPDSYSCGDLNRTYTDNVNGAGYIFEGYYSSAVNRYVHHYGQHGGYNDTYYRLDPEHGRIILYGNNPQSIVLEYISSGVGSGMILSRRAVPALKAYVHWKNINYRRSVAQSEKERLRRDYISEKRKLLALESAFTLDEYLDWKYESMKQTPKI